MDKKLTDEQKLFIRRVIDKLKLNRGILAKVVSQGTYGEDEKWSLNYYRDRHLKEYLRTK